MKLLTKLLVPIDLNRPTENLVDNAIQIAEKFDWEILLLNILPDDAKIPTLEASIKQYATQQMNKVVERIEQKGVSTSTLKTLYGNPMEHILKVSRKEEVSLILLEAGSFDEKNESKVSALVEKVVRKAEKPVWILKPDEVPDIKYILCPVDFSSASERALNNAIQLARKFESQITIISVYESMLSVSAWIDADPYEENMKREKMCSESMDKFLQKFNLDGLSYETRILGGNPAPVISEWVKAERYDVLIMGTEGKSGLGRLLIGSVTQSLLRELPCSMVTTKAMDILNIGLENEINDIEEHYSLAKELEKKGSYKEAIEQYDICTRINSMHIPSLYGIARLYQKTGQEAKAIQFDKMATEVLNRLWDKKIEGVIRNHYLEGPE